MKRFLYLFFIISCFWDGASAQNSIDKIKTSRENTLKEIEYANKLLQETQGKTKESLNEVNLYNHKLAKRKEYLVGLEVEVNVISQSIEKNNEEILKIEKEIAHIKKIYAQMITNLYKNKSTNYQIMYFFAAENFNQLYKRIYTVRLYNNYLKNERYKLEELKKQLESKNKELADLKGQKDVVVNKTRIETITIQKEVAEKNQLVKKLKQRQREIEDDIKNKQVIAKKLENELKKIIEEEKKKIKSKNASDAVTPEDKLVSNDFEKNSGRLPWPTQKGIVTGKYGEHKHPDYKDVIVRNDGIYITTQAGESARAIFKGVVSRVFKIPGENFTVIIKHGQYFSLYHNLADVRVKPGQAVNTKEAIGKIYTDVNTKETILYFQIWKETEKRDPELWLAPL
jgi:septal ring factor EnvC (AmiA/AmiB activator)